MKNKTKEAEQKITSQIKVGVFRRLDNRFENLSDDSPQALELHNRRKEALHEVFDGRKSVEVIDWGQTDDAQPHEFVEIVVGAPAVKVFRYAVVPGLKFLGQKLAEKAVDEASGELVKATDTRRSTFDLRMERSNPSITPSLRSPRPAKHNRENVRSAGSFPSLMRDLTLVS